MARSYVEASPGGVSVFAHLLLIAIASLLLIWLLHFREGVSFTSTNKAKIFNVHPLLMMCYILISGEAIMVYITIPTSRKSHKLFHMILHFTALVVGIIGTYAIFKFHNEAGIPDMYTIHSWIGLPTIILFGLQWLFSFFTFLFPGARMSTRTRIAPWHVLAGIIIFFLAILSAVTGLVEKFAFLGLGRTQEGRLVNFIALLTAIFGIIVGFVVILPSHGYNNQ